MIKLRDQDMAKVANITQIPCSVLAQLSDLNLIDNITMFNIIILHDWKRLKKDKKLTTAQIIRYLIGEYNMSKTKIENIILWKLNSTCW